MCKCTPGIRTPYCGKGDCVWPEPEHKIEVEKLTPDTVRMVLKSLDEEFEKKKLAYQNAKNAIKELCPHSEGTDLILIGEVCSICGKVMKRC